MAVVINEFEVVAEPPRQSEGAPAPGRGSEPTPQASTPRDVERIVRRLHERHARVRAH
jgi:hypothetical protein